MSDPAPVNGRPLVFRGGTVLTMDDASTVLSGADGRDPVARHEHVGAGQHGVLRVEGEHRAAAQHDRGLIRHRPSPGRPVYRTLVRHTVVGGSVRVKE